MKSILQSIKPQHCANIAAYIKKIEVRKSKPNIPTPFKVYIYCTKQKQRFSIGKHIYAFADNLYIANGVIKFGDGFEDVSVDTMTLNGKVIGEYVCDEIINLFALSKFWFSDEILSATCLTPDEIRKYANGADKLYGWHISNLVIYDKPKELSEFRIIVKEYLTKCPFRSRVYNNPNFTNGALLPGAYICFADTEPDYCRGQCDDAAKPLTRPPQSWCYVEEK